MKNLSHIFKSVITLLTAALVPSTGWACACGCDIFEVATSSMFPNQPGGMVFVDYDFQDQNQNWSGTSTARVRIIVTERLEPTSPMSVCNTCSIRAGGFKLRCRMIFACLRQRKRRGRSSPFSGISLATFVLKAFIQDSLLIFQLA